MPRAIEFDPEAALASAMQVFWRNGYADTSIEDIVAETGVSRYGLYGQFGNKKELLIAAIHRYEETVGEILTAELRRPEAGLAAISTFWRCLVERIEDHQFCNGCLVVNVACEVAPHDPDVAAEVQRIDRNQATLFENAIVNGQAAGDIRNDIDPASIGMMMVSIARGLALMVRGGADPSHLKPAASSALALLAK